MFAHCFKPIKIQVQLTKQSQRADADIAFCCRHR